jgi:hypothetical protein
MNMRPTYIMLLFWLQATSPLLFASQGTEQTLRIGAANYQTKQVGSRAVVIPENYSTSLHTVPFFRKPDCAWFDEHLKQVREMLTACQGRRNLEDPLCEAGLAMIDLIRKNDNPSHGSHRQAWSTASLLVAARAESEDVKSVIAQAYNLAAKDILLQTAPVVIINPTTQISVELSAKSRVRFIQETTGIHFETIRFTGDSHQFSTEGMDLACDILAGDASISWSQAAAINVAVPHALTLADLWALRSGLIERGDLSGSSLMEKAASLGFRIHDLLRSVTRAQESIIPDLLESLYQPDRLELIAYRDPETLNQQVYQINTEFQNISATASYAGEGR